jgi:hypothetical protein
MALTIQDFNQLHLYVDNVMVNGVLHHAPNVRDIALAVVGGVVWKATQDIKVMTRNGVTKNVLWFYVGSAKYALTYVHATGDIELRSGSLQGTPIAIFNNSTGANNVLQIFSGL